MLRAAMATCDKALKFAVERTAFFLNPQLPSQPGETMSEVFRKQYGARASAASACGDQCASRSSDKLKVHVALRRSFHE